MQRPAKSPVRRYVEKYAAIDFSAGTYHARKLPRAKYHPMDFMEYLSTYDEGDEDDFMLPDLSANA